MTLRSKSRFGGRDGNVMLEFAIASLILVPMLVGILRFGYTFYMYDRLSMQIRAGARYASKRTFRCDDASIAQFKTAVSKMVRYGNPNGTGSLIEPGLEADQVQVEIKDKDGKDAGPGRVPVSVTVSTVNYTVDAVFQKITLSGKPALQFPFVGTADCGAAF